MPETKEKSFMIEDANIRFRNFRGEASTFNREGERNFCVDLTQELYEDLVADDWNPKILKARDEGEPDIPYIQVTVNYKFKPPRIVMMTSTVRTPVSEDMVEVLDWADIEKVDLICRGYEWDVNGKQGVKAYLKSLVVIIAEDALEKKYHLNEPMGVD